MTINLEQSKMWFTGLHLTQSDRDILLSPTGWLTDTTVNSAQKLIAPQFPHLSGLQNVSKGLTMSYDIMSGDFLQIINTGHVDSFYHWNATSRN